ncbi:MAG: hypothetical protein H5T24_02265 [Bacteroidales bacterium]|nr:hypothetical protein [Bacteroidales bacterium]
MGTPRVELPRDTIRHACGVTHVVSLTKTHRHVPPPTHCRVSFYVTAYGTQCWLRNRIKEELKVLRDASPNSV